MNTTADVKMIASVAARPRAVVAAIAMSAFMVWGSFWASSMARLIAAPWCTVRRAIPARWSAWQNGSSMSRRIESGCAWRRLLGGGLVPVSEGRVKGRAVTPAGPLGSVPLHVLARILRLRMPASAVSFGIAQQLPDCSSVTYLIAPSLSICGRAARLSAVRAATWVVRMPRPQ